MSTAACPQNRNLIEGGEKRVVGSTTATTAAAAALLTPRGHGCGVFTSAAAALFSAVARKARSLLKKPQQQLQRSVSASSPSSVSNSSGTIAVTPSISSSSSILSQALPSQQQQQQQQLRIGSLDNLVGKAKAAPLPGMVEEEEEESLVATGSTTQQQQQQHVPQRPGRSGFILNDDCLMAVFEFLPVASLSHACLVCGRWAATGTLALEAGSRLREAWDLAAQTAFFYHHEITTYAGSRVSVTRFVQLLPVERIRHFREIETYRGYVFPDNVLRWSKLSSATELPYRNCRLDYLFCLCDLQPILPVSGPFCYLSAQKQQLLLRLQRQFRGRGLRLVVNTGQPIQIYQYQIPTAAHTPPLPPGGQWLVKDVLTFSIACFQTDPSMKVP